MLCRRRPSEIVVIGRDVDSLPPCFCRAVKSNCERRVFAVLPAYDYIGTKGNGGELTWRAGPLVKGAGLCHGTAGNGLAFLALFARTGDEIWLARARAFAMHALAQMDRRRKEHDLPWFGLWTGDLGTARQPAKQP